MSAIRLSQLSPGPLKDALESLDYQRNTKLFDELTTAVEKVREMSRSIRNALDIVGIPQIIYRYTGMQIRSEMLVGYPRCMIQVPLIDGRSPLFVELREGLLITDSARPGLDRYVPHAYGMVNLESGKVSGVFSQLVGLLIVGDDMFRYLTDREIAAIVLHELGHQFTYFEYMFHTVKSAVNLNYCATELAKINDKEIRIKIILNTAAALNITVDNVDGLAVSNNPLTPLTVLFEEYTRKVRSGTGAKFYDMRSTEALADQFAVRFGAGKDLATALDKKSRRWGEYRDTSTLANGYIYFVRAVGTSTVAVLSCVYPAIGVFVLAVAALYIADSWPPEGNHDNPRERLIRIKNELIGSLKGDTIQTDERQALHEDIAIVGQLIDKMGEFDSMLSIIWRYLTTYRRENYRQIKFQQELEALANNELFLAASKLKTLSIKPSPGSTP